MNIKQIKKLLEPWIRELIKDEVSNNTENNINKGLEAMELLKKTDYLGKLTNLFTPKKDNLEEVRPEQ